ncbi:Uncharacterized protein GBIM_19165 [Gryllus bimaculatus]|nr:Uncharacterized protein GBIM_19165 [Gryllus bimaculatus]
MLAYGDWQKRDEQWVECVLRVVLQEAALAHFARDAHSDRSPFALEPALDRPDRPDRPETSEDASSSGQNNYERRGRDGPTNAQQSQPLATTWGRRPVSAPAPSSYLPDDSYGLSSDKYIRKHPAYGKDSYTRYAGVSSSGGGSSYAPYSSGSGGYGKYGATGNRYGNQFASAESPSYTSGGGPPAYGASHYGHYDAPTSAAFWTRLGEEIRARVHSGMARVGDLTRPVVQPLLDATQRLGHNLGLTAQQPPAAQRVVLRYDPFLRHPHPHHHHQLHHAHHGNPHGFQEKARLLDTDAILVLSEEPSEAVRSSGDEPNDQQQQRLRRRRRAADGDEKHGAPENSLDAEATGAAPAAVAGSAAAWAHTPCAKRIFCDAMLQRSHDDIVLTEKKMAAAYAQIARGDVSVAFHLGDVMAAVRKGDCSAFACPSGLAPKLETAPRRR